MILGPIGGIFNLAAVLRDGTFENQDEKKFIECFKPKAHATKYFDELSRKLCPQIQFFVVFSSISCGRGNAGQANYGMANSIAERIVERRHFDGLPGIAIQFGPIGEVGMFVNLHKGKEVKELFGMKPQRIQSCLDVLDDLLSCKEHPIVSTVVVADKLKDLRNSKNLIETLMLAMGIPDAKSISLDKPIAELGMDSLGSAEIQQTLEREFGITMTLQELKSITLRELQARINGSKGAEKAQNVSSFMDALWKNLHSGMTSKKMIEEFQVIELAPKMLIVPGMIGGVGTIWSALQYSVYILQHINFYSAKTFLEINEAIEDNVLELFKNDDTFVLVGYSFGSMIALKLCEKLESLGKTGKLIFIDGAPKFMESQLKAMLPENPTDDDIQNLIFIEFTSKIHGHLAEEIMKNIWLQATWSKKVDEFVKLIVDEKSKTFVRQNLEATFNRIKIVLDEADMEFSVSRDTSITLIKSYVPFEATAKIDEAYGLKSYCQQDIKIENIDGDHYNIIENAKIVDILNMI